MTLYEYYMIFPDGEQQEISSPIPAGALVDMNGNMLPARLPTHKMIVYEVAGKRTLEERGLVRIMYILEQLSADELLDYV